LEHHTPHEGQNDLREYLRIVRTRRWSIAFVTILVVGAALFFSFRQTPVYEATSQVLVQSISSNPAQAAPTLDLVTEQQLVSTPVVAQEASKILGGNQSIDALLNDLSVQVVSTSQILRISFSSTDPAFAAKAANAFANGYITYRRGQALHQINAVIADVQKVMARTQADLTAVEAKIASTNDPSRKAALSSQRDTLLARLGVLQQQLDSLQGTATVQQGGGQLVSSATVPTSPASPNHLKTGLLALVVGLALGVGLAFLRERLDDSILTHHELERRLGAPVLGTIPRVPSWRRREDIHLITLEEPKNPVSEAYRTVRTNLQFLASRRNLQTIVVTSCMAGEGKTATAANLAVVMAQAGKRVVLVSADLRRPRVHSFFEASNEKGLSSVLMGSIPIWEAALDPMVINLRIVPSGPIPPNPAELLQSERMEEVLKQLKESADVIIIDTPPVLAVADASILGANADGTLFVVDADTASRAATAQARDQLENAGANVIGSLFNKFDPSQAGGFPHYYYYYHQYAAESEAMDPSQNGKGGEGSFRARRRRRIAMKGARGAAVGFKDAGWPE
jgi:succinoglycan biosynthesis transport protein ExoP